MSSSSQLTTQLKRRSPLVQRPRRGSMTILVAFTMIAMLAVSALIINLSYMQLVDTELRSATDTAARAAAESLARGGTQAQARAEARRIAALNFVAGRSLNLQNSDVVFGTADTPTTGRSTFTPNGPELNAVRILARLDQGSANGAPRLLVNGLLSDENFSSVRAATARIHERDFCLVLDRSGSMNGRDAGTLPGTGTAATRMQALQFAVQEFRRTLDETIGREQMAIASYATNATRDIPLSFNYTPAVDFVLRMRENGMTNIGGGIDQGLAQLRDPARSRPVARPVMVVMTDGIHNENRDPEVATRAAMASVPNLVVYTVTFSGGADRGRMQRVANLGRGRHFHASDLSQLSAVFAEIARTAGTSIIE